ncbi:HAMP domain-containing protein [Microbacterium sp. YMB-B2]|uniref:histidine kinase n=1 Tax=Microbacterium tenebrionis TaxID=2830665 RepID=A0A9X1LQN4_9MICO|nr:ATP-binding protein [Microbacterium tenebrionis]MCC2030115.1 HAMP domain-containing protein [Microbacterium tenebrionis]
MTAVIGFVSIILIIVAVITSATLGTALEGRLLDQVKATASQTSFLVAQRTQAAAVDGQPITAERVLSGQHFQGQGVLLAVASADGATGVVVTSDETIELSRSQLLAINEAVQSSPDASVNLEGVGSFLVTVTSRNGVGIVTGLPRTEIQSTMAQLLTVITLATLGGLILLALTTAVTIRYSLRPLRAVARTATRVANQPLDRGEVEITERVPAAEADPRTETGIVGASLNKLLDHVNDSLAARQRNEALMRKFVADASHELRTPLASIRGYSELSLRALSQGADASGTETALERIQAQSLRMTRLVEDLLLLARLDEGQELVHGTVDLTQLALEGLSDARPTGPEHIWNIDVPAEPVVMLGDAGRLHQVVANLLANARTHTPAGTEITLSVAREGDEAVMRVHDDGPGIEPAVRDQLFARFARGDSSRARQTGGTGLGLAIAKAIVEGHHGTIDVTSEPGSTTFTVRFPLTPRRTA